MTDLTAHLGSSLTIRISCCHLIYIDWPLDPEYVRDPSFESLQVIMDAGRASSHLRRYLRSQLEYYAMKLAFFEAANPQRVTGITCLSSLPRASLCNLKRGRFQCSLGSLLRSNLPQRQWIQWHLRGSG
jgi:hypothetical protein